MRALRGGCNGGSATLTHVSVLLRLCAGGDNGWYSDLTLLMRCLYLITRDLHLYVGLFLSPVVLVFSISVFYRSMGWRSGPRQDRLVSGAR